MPWNTETARLAGKKSKRGPGARAALLDHLFDDKAATKIFKQLELQAINGDMEAIKTYLAYCFGKPEAKLDISIDESSYDLDKLTTEQLKTLYEIQSSIAN